MADPRSTLKRGVPTSLHERYRVSHPQELSLVNPTVRPKCRISAVKTIREWPNKRRIGLMLGPILFLIVVS